MNVHTVINHLWSFAHYIIHGISHAFYNIISYFQYILYQTGIFSDPANLIFHVETYIIVFIISFLLSLFHPFGIDMYIFFYILINYKSNFTICILYITLVLIVNIFANLVCIFFNALIYKILEHGAPKFIHKFKQFGNILYIHQTKWLCKNHRDLMLFNLYIGITIPFIYFWYLSQKNGNGCYKACLYYINSYLIKILIYILLFWLVIYLPTEGVMDFSNYTTYVLFFVTIFVTLRSIITGIKFILDLKSYDDSMII